MTELDRSDDLNDMQWEIPNCANCAHNINGYCEVFQEIAQYIKQVDIFNCPEFEEEKEKKQMFGIYK